ncbi:unnamed protein product, partial [Mesorhabditis spiculigera]
MATIAPRCRMSVKLAKQALLCTRPLSKKAAACTRLGAVAAQRSLITVQDRLKSTNLGETTSKTDKATLSLFGVTDTLEGDKQKYSDALTQAASAFHDAEQIFNDPSFESKKGWSVDEKVDEDLRVYSKKTDKAVDMVAVTSVLLGHVDCVHLDVWTQPDDLKKWKKMVDHSCFVAQLTDHADIIHGSTNSMLVSDGRDFVTARIWRKIGDSYIIASRSVDVGEEPYEGKVRGTVHLAACRLRPDPEDPKHKTLCDVIAHVDPKGNIPKAAVNMVCSKLALMEAKAQKKHFEMLQGQGKLGKQ